MTVYILHFNSPVSHAKHYTGYSADVVGRVMDHMEGKSKARIMEVLHERGIGFALARTFDGADRKFERKLKKTHKVRLYCPICMGDKVRDYVPTMEEKDGTTEFSQ